MKGFKLPNIKMFKNKMKWIEMIQHTICTQSARFVHILVLVRVTLCSTFLARDHAEIS